ncbi:MAG: hypothetical protein QXL96_10695 [Ignisphaera sp.]
MYKLIYFFGSDGTGKTTQAELVSSWLRRRGYKVWRASIKHHHSLSYIILKTISYGNPYGKIISYYGFNGVLAQKIKTPWKILELMSLFLAVFYRVLLPLLLGYVIVCDRYVLDTLVTLSYFLKDPGLVTGVPIKLMVKLIPKNSLLFYLDAETKVILRRKKDEPLTTYLIEYYRKAYRIVNKQLKVLNIAVIQINTTDTSMTDVYRIIVSYLKLGSKTSLVS